MIALDTSALLRYLIGDDTLLADRVARVIEGDEPVGVSTPVLVEAVHTLRGLPNALSNPEVADTLVELLAHENVVLTDLSGDLASAPLRVYATSRPGTSWTRSSLRERARPARPNC